MILRAARADKFFRIVVIKEIKGSQYGVQVESAVRDRLAEVDKYEEEEEAALDQVVQFFQSKYFKKDSVITFTFPATAAIAEVISFTYIVIVGYNYNHTNGDIYLYVSLITDWVFNRGEGKQLFKNESGE